jgi:hypothetical protein
VTGTAARPGRRLDPATGATVLVVEQRVSPAEERWQRGGNLDELDPFEPHRKDHEFAEMARKERRR